MLRLEFKNMFRKGNSKIYNFPVEAKFKFALEEAEKGSTDPMESVHRARGIEAKRRTKLKRGYRAGGSATE